MNIRKYGSAEYLAFYVALLALIMSQLPPVATWFGRDRISVAIGTFGQITHNLGNSVLLVPISTTNIGSRSITIQRIDCELRSQNGGDTLRLRAEGVVDSSTRSFIPISQLYFQPESSWNHVVQCTQIPSRQGYLEINRLLVRAQNYGYREVNSPGFRPGTPVFLPDDLVAEAVGMFEKNFKLSSGQWQLAVSMYDAKGRTIGRATAELLLSDEVIGLLRDSISEYRMGFGLNLPAMPRYLVPVPMVALDNG